MSSVRIDPQLSSDLKKAHGVVEVRDESGEIIGVFTSLFRSQAEFTHFVSRLLPDPKLIALQKQSQEKLYTTDEVREYLSKLSTK